jgi:carbon starvation protein CstA
MITFFSSIALLLLGYFLYSKVIEKIMDINPNAQTPAFSKRDNIDFVPMSKSRNALINLLNIAGTGPIFGPILASMYGPVALLWIVLGCIFAGAVHDFVIGIVSLRNNGATLPMLAEKYLSKIAKHVVNLFSLILLLLVATVFVVGPANLLKDLIKDILPFIHINIIVAVIFIYYFFSTMLPIDKLIGKIYPYLGALLLLSTMGIFISIIFFLPTLAKPELNLTNMHPDNLPIFPLLFLVLSCGAISGFHSTQIPIVARTIQNENNARSIFYGMMITEGVIALTWAYATLVLLDGQTLAQLIKEGTPSLVVSKIALITLGSFLGTFVVLGVIVLPLTSGDTAFRSIRLMLSEYLKIDQNSHFKRLIIAIPSFVISIILTNMDFQILWQYFSWANQTLSAIGLWICTIYLIKTNKPMYYAFIPALFMTFVVFTYILYAKIGLNLDLELSKIIAGLLTIIIGLFVFMRRNQLKITN